MAREGKIKEKRKKEKKETIKQGMGKIYVHFKEIKVNKNRRSQIGTSF